MKQALQPILQIDDLGGARNQLLHELVDGQTGHGSAPAGPLGPIRVARLQRRSPFSPAYNGMTVRHGSGTASGLPCLKRSGLRSGGMIGASVSLQASAADHVYGREIG